LFFFKYFGKIKKPTMVKRICEGGGGGGGKIGFCVFTETKYYASHQQ